MIIKKKNIRTIVITCALLGIIIFSIHSYNVYMSRQIYNEGTFLNIFTGLHYLFKSELDEAERFFNG